MKKTLVTPFRWISVFPDPLDFDFTGFLRLIFAFWSCFHSVLLCFGLLLIYRLIDLSKTGI